MPTNIPPPPNGVLYEPLNRTNRGSSAENIRRGRSIKKTICCRVLILIVVLSALGGIYLFGKFAKAVWKTINVGHHDLIMKEKIYTIETINGTRKKQLENKFTVSPLLNLNDTFSIRATVWFDVTQHLEQGNSLPTTLSNGSPINLITYNVDANTTRSEIILYSDVILKDIKSKERHSTIIPFSLPIDPLYTQDLGPSTLRITYTVDVDSESIEKDLGQFQLGQGIFPFSSYVLPRSQSSVRITKGCDGFKNVRVEGTGLKGNIIKASTLEESLEINGASSSLLSLRSTQKSKLPNCTYDQNINLSFQYTPGFLDNAPDRRSFTRKTILDKQGKRLILANDCQKFIPVIQTQSSIYLFRSNEDLHLLRYSDKLENIKRFLQPCFDEEEEIMPEFCFKELRKHGPLENWLTFSKIDSIKDGLPLSKMRYGPAIVQRQFSTPPWEQRVIPQKRPQQKGKMKENRTNQSLFWFMKNNEKKKEDLLENCKLPEIDADESFQFFDVDLNVRFGSDLGTLRSSLIELDISSLGEKDDSSSSKIELDFLQDEDEEMIILNSIDKDVKYELASFLVSDHFHPNRKSFIKISTYFLLEFSSFVTFSLSVLYWYTRTTTAGLSIRAQWIQCFGVLIRLILILFDIKNAGILSTNTIDFIGIGSCLLLKALALKRIDFIFPQEGKSWLTMRIIQRPKDKVEKQCEKVEKEQIGWLKIGLIFCIFSLFCFISGREGFLLNRGRGCSMMVKEINDDLEDKKKFIKEWISLFAYTITFAGQSIQIWFNTISPALYIKRKGKVGTFAGMFKSSVYIETFLLMWEQLISNVEWIGGHSVRKEAIQLDFIQTSIEKIILFWQAIYYPGIPLGRSESDDDDEEEEEERYDM